MVSIQSGYPGSSTIVTYHQTLTHNDNLGTQRPDSIKCPFTLITDLLPAKACISGFKNCSIYGDYASGISIFKMYSAKLFTWDGACVYILPAIPAIYGLQYGVLIADYPCIIFVQPLHVHQICVGSGIYRCPICPAVTALFDSSTRAAQPAMIRITKENPVYHNISVQFCKLPKQSRHGKA